MLRQSMRRPTSSPEAPPPVTPSTVMMFRSRKEKPLTTKRRQLPNLQTKRIFIPELNRWVRLRLSTRSLRTLSKKGLMRFLKDEGKTLKEVIG